LADLQKAWDADVNKECCGTDYVTTDAKKTCCGGVYQVCILPPPLSTSQGSFVSSLQFVYHWSLFRNALI